MSGVSLPQAMQVAMQHHQAGKLAEAQQIYRQVLGHDPRHAGALCLLGMVTDQLGEPASAIALFEQALAVRADWPLALCGLGNALRNLGQLAPAERACRRAIALEPAFADAHNNLGNVLTDLGRFAEAESAYRRVLALKPDVVEAYSNLANVESAQRRYAEAEAHARHALALRPAFPQAHNNLGNALQGLGRFAEAEQHYRRAIELLPGYAEACSNLGNTLRALGRAADAEACYRKALSHQPRFAQAHFNLASALQERGLLDEAAASLQQALALRPGFAEAQALALHLRRHLCAWPEPAGAPLEAGRVHPFMFLFEPRATPELQLASARAYAEREFRALLAVPPLAGAPSPARRPRLRVGYLSADYHDHATSRLLVDVIERHDRKRFEVYAYSHGPDDGSALGRRIRGAFDVFRDVRSASNLEAARSIAADGIDILVDLKGYTARNRTQILALRPAPLQVSWLGYPGTLGHARLADWLIGDAIVTPPEHAAAYSEKLALMPHCYQPNDPARAIGPRPARREAGLPARGFVFCSFNQAYKITPGMFTLWCRLLESVPGSVLWLLEPAAPARANLLREAASRGIAAQRVVFAPHWPAQKHLGRLQLADLALDTFPVTSHTTASDALWAGVPLVTQRGATFVSRVAASILHAAGLPELVAGDAEAYYRTALELARDAKRLRRLRKALAADRANLPLFDGRQFARDLEALYDRIWEAPRR